MRVKIKPEMLKWAISRSGIGQSLLQKRLPKFEEWEREESQPTLKQLELFAHITHTPVGYLFLQFPPQESLPIPDFRITAREYFDRPSPDLLDTIYVCQQRQAWYREYARETGEKPLPFVGSAKTDSDIVETAEEVRHALKLDIEERRHLPTWTDALRQFIEKTDNLGILTMCSGVVQNNNYRHLNTEEFRGFAVADEYAPLIFINGADTKAAQMFTLAHEIGHIWLGQSAVTDSDAAHVPDQTIERWCNQLAAGILVPNEAIRSAYRPESELHEEINRLAHYFKVSSLVILRRIFDIGGLTQNEFWENYHEELKALRPIKKGTGGDFYLTQAARASKRFARALVVDTLEGRTGYSDAFRLLGFSKMETFYKLGRSLGVGV